MAKKAKSCHAKALAAFRAGWITREEYKLCCKEDAWVSGRTIYLSDGDSWVASWRPKDGKQK